MSKAFAMTGWRLGYAAGPKEIIEAMSKVQSHTTSHPASMSQVAGRAALLEAREDVARMAVEFERRRDAIVAMMSKIPGISCVPPDGAFYVFPNVSGLFGATIGGRSVDSGKTSPKRSSKPRASRSCRAKRSARAITSASRSRAR
jgi:aspartate aminotransferase